LKIGARKSPETVVVSGFSGAISFLVAQHGQAVNNALEQAHFKNVAKSML
jgi:NADPH-dependent curcumin reductase CurA